MEGYGRKGINGAYKNLGKGKPSKSGKAIGSNPKYTGKQSTANVAYTGKK